MTNWPIGLSTGCFYMTNILDCLETIRASGFSMIEVVFSPAHLDYKNTAAVREAAARIDSLGMEVYSFHAPFASDIDISSPDAGCREYALDEILRRLKPQLCWECTILSFIQGLKMPTSPRARNASFASKMSSPS